VIKLVMILVPENYGGYVLMTFWLV
jgi:hypothetical protein